MPGRLVVASNRLPVAAVRQGDAWVLRPSPGGLVAALGPALKRRRGTWVGWSGVAGRADLGPQLARQSAAQGYELHAVELTPEEHERFYYGFSNEVIWPLFHDMPSFCVFDPAFWRAYVKVNGKFATRLAEVASDDDFVWIHDYHLMETGRQLRNLGVRNRLGFFLHIPFPARDLFLKLPWREQVLAALLQYDVLGFQNEDHLHNFLENLAVLVPTAQWEWEGGFVRVHHAGRSVRVGSFPIGIDVKEVRRKASSPEVAQKADLVRRRVPDRRFLLGVDRLDYTKGIPQKIRAFQRALEQYPELREAVTLLQIVSPSREDIPRYHELRREIERLVGEVNGAHYTWGWQPIHYVSRSIDEVELLAWYRTADVAFITPLRDGMNLVAKEYVASRTDGDGVLVLSEFAGAASALRGEAILVNPYNVDAMAKAIRSALSMPEAERRARMARLQQRTEETNVHWWVDSFLRAADPPSPGPKGRGGAATARPATPQPRPAPSVPAKPRAPEAARR